MGYRELYTRMFQYGAFLPVFRSHGTDTPREVWRFGKPGEPFYDSLIQMIHLRYRLLPYIYSYILAYVLKYGKNLYKVFFFMPSLFSLSVASILFLWIYNPLAGPIDAILQIFGLDSPRWLKEPILVIFSISMIIAWKVFGYNFILMLAAMMSVSKEMIEAARLEGASDWVILRKIIIPQTSSSAIYVFVITVVFGLQYVMIPVNILTQGGPNQGSANLVYVIYQYAFVFYQVGKSAAYAVLTMLLFVIFAWWRNKVLDKKVYYEN